MPVDGAPANQDSPVNLDKRKSKLFFKRTLVLGMIVVLGWAAFKIRRGFTEYDLGPGSYMGDALEEIQKATGVVLSAEAKILNYHYKPPIDPIVFAKIEIPAADEKSMVEQIAALPAFKGKFHEDFANKICKWWPASFQNPVMAKNSYIDGYYIETHLMKEQGKLVLYLKYFTI